MERIGTLTEYIVARETHEDGGFHIHAVVAYSRKIDTKNPRYFDCDEYHCKAVVIGKRNEEWNNRWNYCLKEDTESLHQGGVKGANKWAGLVRARDEQDFWAIAAEEHPREYIINHAQLEHYVRKKFQRETPYKPIFERFNVPDPIEDYLSGNFRSPRPVRPRSLILG